MPLHRVLKLSLIILSACVVLIGITVGVALYLVTPHQRSAPPNSTAALLNQADALAWGNKWADAEPLYRQAELRAQTEQQPSLALYAHVSQIPPDETVNIPKTIWTLTQDLALPAAQVPETKLRILLIRGMLEINYDATSANRTWQQISELAKQQQNYALVTRATGEQGIAAFLMGDTETAKKKVRLAWTLSIAERDPAATVRYASMFGAGLVQIHRYKEALTPLHEAMRIADQHKDVAYPTIAAYSLIDALAGLHRYDEALSLANTSLTRLEGTRYDGHKAQVYISRGSIDSQIGNEPAAIKDFSTSLLLSEHMSNYRAITDAGGQLAAAYENSGDLPAALTAINSAIKANTQIPDELYLVPRNLAIKADITSRMGRYKEANSLYRASEALVNNMVAKAPTTNIQRNLLGEMSTIYSSSFASLCKQKRYDEALQTLEQVRGRVESEAIQHHSSHAFTPPTPEEQELTRLNLELVNTDNPSTRSALTDQIYNAELNVSPSSLTQTTITHPVALARLQRAIPSTAVLIEYVLAEPHSYAFVLDRSGVKSYELAPMQMLEADATLYRKEISTRKSDLPLARKLFDELLAPVPQYAQKSELVIIPDGALHLLPFATLADSSNYVLASHTIDVAPSSTVYELLQRRSLDTAAADFPYIGVAAWTQTADNRNAVVRAITGPQRSQLVPLPDSKAEVETIATDLPHPNRILLGPEATEANFKTLALQSADVIHLALHGYVDLDYPDRSALIFAPDPHGNEDGLLQVREVRQMHLNSKLVTLSACNTGVGPVAEAGVTNLVNAFIEAGASTVVSTLWELEDHSTEHLMTMFYEHLGRHEPKVDALRAAQLELLNEGLPPYFWGSFQIVGDADSTI